MRVALYRRGDARTLLAEATVEATGSAAISAPMAAPGGVVAPVASETAGLAGNASPAAP
jgi:hypothetical protein